MKKRYIEPDISDLNDWLLFTNPKVYEAIKYLSAKSFYDTAYKIWVGSGRPDIRDIIY
jgi:hypothetical protein